jgi:hypothetical protein
MTAAIAAVILLATNFTITNAQQQLTGQPGEIENGTAATAGISKHKGQLQSTGARGLGNSGCE